VLQIQNGHHHPELRTTNTLSAVEALKKRGIISPSEHRKLRDAYVFFRRLIDGLRMVRGNARDLTTPAAATEEFEFLARRLGYAGQATLLEELLEDHVRNVDDIVRRHLSDEIAAAKA
jgi:glutamate-ammonia-ligase adenylyltransferase